jgi:hypothetical protein
MSDSPHRRLQFKRALNWAETLELAAGHQIENIVYLRLCVYKADDLEE